MPSLLFYTCICIQYLFTNNHNGLSRREARFLKEKYLLTTAMMKNNLPLKYQYSPANMLNITSDVKLCLYTRSGSLHSSP